MSRSNLAWNKETSLQPTEDISVYVCVFKFMCVFVRVCVYACSSACVCVCVYQLQGLPSLKHMHKIYLIYYVYIYFIFTFMLIYPQKILEKVLTFEPRLDNYFYKINKGAYIILAIPLIPIPV